MNTFKFMVRDNDAAIRYLPKSSYKSHFVTKENYHNAQRVLVNLQDVLGGIIPINSPRFITSGVHAFINSLRPDGFIDEEEVRVAAEVTGDKANIEAIRMLGLGGYVRRRGTVHVTVDYTQFNRSPKSPEN